MNIQSMTPIVQGHLKLYRQLKVFKRTRKTTRNENTGLCNVFMKKTANKYDFE